MRRKEQRWISRHEVARGVFRHTTMVTRVCSRVLICFKLEPCCAFAGSHIAPQAGLRHWSASALALGKKGSNKQAGSGASEHSSSEASGNGALESSGESPAAGSAQSGRSGSPKAGSGQFNLQESILAMRARCARDSRARYLCFLVLRTNANLQATMHGRVLARSSNSFTAHLALL